MKKIQLIIVFLLCIPSLILISSCKKKSLNKKRLSLVNRVLLYNIREALFIYYIDNNRFPSNEEGLVFGLLKTGINPPYFFSKEKHYLNGTILRKNEKEKVYKKSEVSQGDVFLFGDEIKKGICTYKLSSDRKSFLLFGKNEKYFLSLFFANKKLKFKNLPRLKYKKNLKFSCGEDYISLERFKMETLYYLKKNQNKLDENHRWPLKKNGPK